MTRFTSALTALLLVASTAASNTAQDLDALQLEHPDSRELSRQSGSQSNPFGGSSGGSGARGARGGTSGGGQSSSSVEDPHPCTATITFGAFSANLEVNNTNTVEEVEQLIEDEFDGVEVPDLADHPFFGDDDAECDSGDMLYECGFCEEEDEEIEIEITGSAETGWNCTIRTQVQFTSRTQNTADLDLDGITSMVNTDGAGRSSGGTTRTGFGSGNEIGLGFRGGTNDGGESGTGRSGDRGTTRTGFGSGNEEGGGFRGGTNGGGDLTTDIRHNGGVRVRYGEDIIVLSDIFSDDTLGTIKKRLEDKTDLTSNNMRLSYNGEEMGENHYEITKDFGYDVTKQPQDILLLENVAEERSKSFNGGAKGDPHFVMWNGRKFDFHGGCDLVLVEDPTFDNGAGIKIHVRTKVLRWFSFVDSVVVQIGEDTLEVAGGFERRRYWVNGVQGDYIKVNGRTPFTIGGKQVRFQVMRNNISFQFKIVLDEKKKETIILRAVKDYMRIDLSHPREDLFADSVGLMGGFNDTEDKMLARDGATIMEDINEYSMEWQVRDTEPMLFHDVEGPQYPEACEMPSEDRVERRRLSSSVNQDEAEMACSKVDESERESCVMDVIATGDLELADAY